MKKKKKIKLFLGLAVFSTSYISSQISCALTYNLHITEIPNLLKHNIFSENGRVFASSLQSSTGLQNNSSTINEDKLKTQNKKLVSHLDSIQGNKYFAAADPQSPSIKKIYTIPYNSFNELQALHDGETKIDARNIERIVIEFNDTDVIQKNALGSSVYAGTGVLQNDLIKLTRKDNETNQDKLVDISAVDSYGNKAMQLVDDTDANGEGTDKLVITPASSVNSMGLLENSSYNLSIGHITDASQNVMDSQSISFVTGPAPILNLNKASSGIENTGSSVDVSKLITNIKVDGNYSGFVIDAGYSDINDKLANVNTDTVKVYDNSNNELLSPDKYEVNLSVDKREITIKPNSNGLEKSKVYYVVINGVTDIAGNPIDNKDGNINNQYKFYFKTEEPLSITVTPLGYYVLRSPNGSYGMGGVNQIGSIVIEFNSKDIISKKQYGSSFYVGNGSLINDLIKLKRIDNDTVSEQTLDLNGSAWGNYGCGNIVTLIDDTDLNDDAFNSGKKDKIVINTLPPQFEDNSKYKLEIGNITDASGNIIVNPQTISFTTGPAPVLNLNKAESGVGNTGSSIDAGTLITDIRVDGSYSGFVVDTGYSDPNDKLTNINANTVSIYDNENNAKLISSAYSVSLSGDGKKITIKPNANALQKNKIYSVVINGVTDAEGNPISNIDGTTNNQYRFYFQTGDSVPPSMGKVSVANIGNSGTIYSQTEVKNGDKGIVSYNNSIIIEFNDSDVIKKNALGSSVYAGVGTLENDLLKLSMVDGITGEEKTVNIGGFDRYSNRGLQLIDDSHSYGNGKDKIVITPMSSMDMTGLLQNSTYNLNIGNITDASGNVLSNPQTISFTTGPAPLLNLNKAASGVGNTGSSINAGTLITDIKVDGSYNGFVVDAGYTDPSDKLSNVNTNTVSIYDNENNSKLSNSAYTVGLSEDGMKITIKPNAGALQKNKIYSIVISGVTDAEGNPIANIDGTTNNQYRFYFQTGDSVPPSMGKVSVAHVWNNGTIYSQSEVKNGDKGIVSYNNSIIIEFNDSDVIKKNALGSSVYAGIGTLENDLLKLTRVDALTGQQKEITIGGTDRYGNRSVQFIDDSDVNGNGKDKIVITPMSSMDMTSLLQNSTYNLSIGNITDASGNVLTNPQSISFTTGPAPLLNLNKAASGVGNTGSSIDAGTLITDIRVDGSYNGFVVDAGYTDPSDKLSNVNTNTVSIYDNENNSKLSNSAYTVGLSEDGMKITIKPNAGALQKNKIYSIVISGVTDAEGNPIANIDGTTNNQYRFYFQTGDALPPSVEKVYTSTDEYGMYNQKDLLNGDKGINVNRYSGSIVIEFNDKDVIKKNALGSSIYAGSENLVNNLIKLAKVDSATGTETLLNLEGINRNGHYVVTLEDDSDYYSQGKDKIIINPTSSINMAGLEDNSKYTLTIGNITDASGNVITNPQVINFQTGPGPMLTINKVDSEVGNTGSSLDVGKLITDIKVDGSYSGFVLEALNDESKLTNVTTDTIKIYENGNTVPIDADAYAVALSTDGRKITIKPNADRLEKNKTYRLVLNGIKDQEDNLISNYDFNNNIEHQCVIYFKTVDTVAPRISVYSTRDSFGLCEKSELYSTGLNLNSHATLVIEFNDNDVIRKNPHGSSVYVGNGALLNNHIKLVKVDNLSQEETQVNLVQSPYYGEGLNIIDDTEEQYSEGKDKIVISTDRLGLGYSGSEENSRFKLVIGTITDASGNIIENPQTINLITGPAPVLSIDKIRSKVNNTGSGLDAASLITNIKVDGSYSGFVLGEINDPDDRLTNVTTKTVKIYESGSSVPIGEDSYTVSVAPNGRSMNIIPNQNKLQKGKIYSVIVNGVTDTEGNLIINKDCIANVNNQYRFYFKTEESVIPPIVIPTPPIIVQPAQPVVLSTVTPATVVPPSTSEVKQAKTISTPEQPITPSKAWTITFTKEVGIEVGIAENVIVLDSNGKVVPVKINILSDKKSITITPASGSYNSGQTYTLYLNKKVDSAEGKNLKSSYKINFTITK